MEDSLSAQSGIFWQESAQTAKNTVRKEASITFA